MHFCIEPELTGVAHALAERLRAAGHRVDLRLASSRRFELACYAPPRPGDDGDSAAAAAAADRVDDDRSLTPI